MSCFSFFKQVCVALHLLLCILKLVLVKPLELRLVVNHVLLVLCQSFLYGEDHFSSSTI